MRSIAWLTAVRSRRRSVPRGAVAGDRRLAITRSARPRPGSEMYSTPCGAGRSLGAARSGATFADAAAEWLRFVEEDRECSRRPFATIAQSWSRGCCRPSVRCPSKASRAPTWRSGVRRSPGCRTGARTSCWSSYTGYFVGRRRSMAWESTRWHAWENIAETSVYGVVVMMTSDEIWRDPMSPCLVKGRGLAFRTLPSAWYGGSSPGAGAFGVEHARLHLRLKGALWRGRSRSSRLSLVGERRHREAWSARWIGIE